MSSLSLPKTAKALTVQKATATNSNNGRYPYDAVLVERPLAKLQQGQVLLKVNTVGFNHKDVWIRKGMYPGITEGSPYGGDCAGVVVASADPDDSLLNKRVLLNPSVGWKTDPDTPESHFDVLGGTALGGTFSEYLVVERHLLIPSPDHLTDVQVAVLPLGGVTAWRAAIVNAQAKKGQNVLITGIGGGVALLALQYCVAVGANVYVTSGKEEKIKKAIELGAKGGANYKEENWPEQIKSLLEKGNKGAELDAVIDSGGGPILEQVRPILKHSGRFVCFGMTAVQHITITMLEVIKNLKFLGSTMGSQKDLEDAIAFITKHRIVPVVSHVLDGFEGAKEGYGLLDKADQFGKVIVRLGESNPSPSI